MGSVHAYTTAEGGRMYRISYRRPNHKQTNVRGFHTKREAQLRLAELEISKSRGEYVDPADSRATIRDPWRGLAQLENCGSEAVDLPVDRFELADPRRAEVGETPRRCNSLFRGAGWIASLASTHSATTVRRVHEVLAGILDVAVRDRRIPTNVARGIKLPRKVAKSRAYLTHEQVALLAAESKNPELVVFLAYTGLRWGEATGLRVKHVDLGRRRVNVEENAVEVGSRIKIGTPKTHERRQVRYPALLDETIARLRAGKSQDQLLFGTGSRMCVDRSRRPVGSTARCSRLGPTCSAKSSERSRRAARSPHRSRASPRTTCGKRPRASRSAPARTPRPSSGCSVTRLPR